MKRRLLALSALLIFSMGFFFIARSAASWRPQIIGVAPGAYNLLPSPDGRWLAATSTDMSASDEDQEWVYLFDTTGHVKTRVFPAGFTKFCADGQRLVAFDSSTQRLQLIDTATGRAVQSWTDLTPGDFEIIGDAQLQNGGRELVVATPFRVWRLDVKSGQVLSQVKIQIAWQMPEGCGMMGGQTLFRDGRRVLYLNGEKAWIYDAATGKRLASCEMGDLAPDEKTLYNWSPESGGAWLVDLKSGQTRWQAAMENPPQWTADGRAIIDVGDRSGVRLLDARNSQAIEKLKVPIPQSGARGENPAYALSPDGDYWFARQDDKIVRYRVR